jgi:hypothetical protein
LSVPDAIGIAIEEWHRDRVVGVQGELMPPPTAEAGGPPASEMVTSMTHQVPAALRSTGNSAAEMELQFGYIMRRRRSSGRARIVGRRWNTPKDA